MNINFIFLAKTSNQKQYEMTCTAFDSLIKSKSEDDNFYTLLIESQKGSTEKYNNFDKVIDVSTYIPFNYNQCINIALQNINKNYEWICICNNDLVFNISWLDSIKLNLQKNPDVKSVCPRYSIKQKENEFGYICSGYILGWCFMFHKDVLDEIGEFDENFDFYFQDDDYAEQLKKYNIKHMSVATSIVTHLGQQTTGPEKMNVLLDGANKFIAKYGLQTYLVNEQNKHKLLSKNFN